MVDGDRDGDGDADIDGDGVGTVAVPVGVLDGVAIAALLPGRKRAGYAVLAEEEEGGEEVVADDCFGKWSMDGVVCKEQLM